MFAFLAVLPIVSFLYALLNIPFTFILLAVPIHARLWGWPDDFSVSFHYRGRVTETIPQYGVQVCSGWGNWCDPTQCQWAQQLRTNGNNPKDIWRWRWMQVRKQDAAWIDLWRSSGDTFNLFETGRAEQQGQCQLAGEQRVNCGDDHYIALVHCWQW